MRSPIFAQETAVIQSTAQLYQSGLVSAVGFGTITNTNSFFVSGSASLQLLDG